MAESLDLASLDRLLTTTRSVRKRLDLERPVDPQVIADCLEIAIQAPTASNGQLWHFVVITDAEKRARIGAWYRDSFRLYNQQRPAPLQLSPERQAQLRRVISSSTFLAENMGRVPILVIPCYQGRVETAEQMSQAALYGSILPAAWSFMLALRARGLGSAWTTLHLRYADEVGQLLGLPDGVTQAALLPVAYYTGETFKPASRVPATEVTSWNEWGNRR